MCHSFTHRVLQQEGGFCAKFDIVFRVSMQQLGHVHFERKVTENGRAFLSLRGQQVEVGEVHPEPRRQKKSVREGDVGDEPVLRSEVDAVVLESMEVMGFIRRLVARSSRR